MKTLSQLLACSLLVSGFCWGQSSDVNDIDNWYQIEVFVFANTAHNAGIDENWPEQPDLSYPQNLVELINPEISTSVTEDNTEILDADLAPIEEQRVEESDNTVIDKAPQALELFPAEKQLLTPHVKKLLSTGQHRLLFHEAWLQPLQERDQSVSILIRGGEQFDQHYELEGYITLSVERYLHINTDLWLSQFVSTLGMDQSPWSVLPIPPTVLKSKMEQQALMANELGINPLAESDPFGLGGSDSFQLMFDKQYTVEQTVVMKQNRRMRSNELHYLDHPKMGLLVKIIPYEPEETDESAPAAQTIPSN